MQIVLVQRQQVLAQIIGTDVVIVHSVEPFSHQIEHRRGVLYFQFGQDLCFVFLHGIDHMLWNVKGLTFPVTIAHQPHLNHGLNVGTKRKARDISHIEVMG